MQPEAVRRWRADDLALRTATPRVTLLRLVIPGMIADGVLVPRGRFWYGRAVDIDAWLLNKWQRTPNAGAAR